MIVGGKYISGRVHRVVRIIGFRDWGILYVKYWFVRGDCMRIFLSRIVITF